MTTEHILLFEDTDVVARLYSRVLSNRGYRVDTFSMPHELLQRPDCREVLASSALVLTDGNMPRMHGLELARTLRIEHDYSKPIIYNSAYVDSETHPQTLRATRADGTKIFIVDRVFQKPVLADDLLAVISDALGKKP